MDKFEKEVLGNAPSTKGVDIKEESPEVLEEKPKEEWELMPLKELRKYYQTQIEERRYRERLYLEQQKKCKAIREKMKGLEAK